MFANNTTFNPQTGNIDKISDLSVCVSYDGLPGLLLFKQNGDTLELWWKGLLVDSWTYEPEAPPLGSPMGLCLLITYPV